MKSTRIITQKETWENFFIDSKLASTFFQSWNWGEFQLKLGHKPLRIGFFEDEKLKGAAQAIVIKAKRGKYLYVRNGPVIDWSDKKMAEFVIKSLEQKTQEEGSWFVRISPLVKSGTSGVELIKKYPVSPMYDVDALDTWILDLDQSEEQILQNMRKSTRYEIRKAEREGVRIIKSQNTEDLDKFYPIYEDTVKRQKWTGYSSEYLKKQFETFAEDNQAVLYLAEYDNKLIAGSIFIFWNDSCFYHYSGSLTEYRKIPGSSLIQWQSIQEAKKRGLKKYNFWGIPPKNRPHHPWQGLGFYKMGFGGYAERWLPTRDIPVSLFYWITNLVEKWQKRKKGY